MAKQDKDKAALKREKLLRREAKTKAKFEKRIAKQAAKKKQYGSTVVEKNTSDWTTDNDMGQDNEPINEEPKKGFWARRSSTHQFKKNLYDRKDLKREKEAKEKTDYKLAFKEFPVKMVKEVNKIKWSGKKNLTTKFIQVILFMLAFAIFFYLIDWAFQAIFTAIHVI